jgi:hypothetical protein
MHSAGGRSLENNIGTCFGSAHRGKILNLVLSKHQDPQSPRKRKFGDSNTKHEPRTWTQNCSEATPDLTGGYTEQSSLNPKYGIHI